MLGHQVAIGAVVVVAEEGLRPAVAALCDVVGKTGKDGASQAGHGRRLGLGGKGSIECTVTVIHAGEASIEPAAAGPQADGVNRVHCHRNSDFIAGLERLLGRPIAKRAPGRKPKGVVTGQLDLLN